MEMVWFFIVAIGFWLPDPIPWLVIAVVMVALRRWWGRRPAFVVAVALGAVAGEVTMFCLGKCQVAETDSLVFAAFIALCDALIAAFFISGLLDLVAALLARRIAPK